MRVTGQFQYNHAYTQERGIVLPSPAAGTTRSRHHLALQEAFGELKLFDVGSNYDFVSVRAGIQPFSSDFRGFLYVDNELGVRLFGNAKGQRQVYNVGFFSMRERKGVFHDISKTLCPKIADLEREELQCGQTVIVGNFFFAANGADTYTAMVNVPESYAVLVAIFRLDSVVTGLARRISAQSLPLPL